MWPETGRMISAMRGKNEAFGFGWAMQRSRIEGGGTSALCPVLEVIKGEKRHERIMSTKRLADLLWLEPGTVGPWAEIEGRVDSYDYCEEGNAVRRNTAETCSCLAKKKGNH